MSHLPLFGVLVVLAISGLAPANAESEDIHRASLRYPIHKSLLRHVRQAAGPVVSSDVENPKQAPVRPQYTPFERRVIRLLRKLGILTANDSANDIVETLRASPAALRKLKKLLDKLDNEEEESDPWEDLIDEIIGVFHGVFS
ncbi:hypothetical protein KR009_004915 [Drosophila setifemur]|nr:hypothetical protein KR009_004915 [Drosophila setifemur]